MTKDLGLSVAAGLLSAFLFLAAAAGAAVGFLLTYVSPLPLFMAGLALGLPAALVAGGAGLVAAAVFGSGLAMPAYGVAVALPAVLVVRQALLWRQAPDGTVQWYPPGLLLGWLTAVALALMLGSALLLPAHEAGAEGAVRDFLARGLTAMAPELDEASRAAVIDVWAPLFPAMMAGVWLVMAVANAAMAQWLVERMGRARRPGPSYQALDAPDWLAAALVASVVAAVLGEGSLGYAARNVGALLLLPYVLLGLSVVHRLARRRANPATLLAIFYVVFFLAFGWVVIAVAGIGLVRHWMNLRRRLAGGRGQEDE